MRFAHQSGQARPPRRYGGAAHRLVALVGVLLGLAAWVPTVPAASSPPFSFTAPSPLSPSDDTTYAPHIALTRNGDAVAIWGRALQEDFSTNVIESATRRAHARWSAPTVLSALIPRPSTIELGDASPQPHVGVSGNGDVVAVWIRIVAFNSAVIEAATRTRRGPWSAPVLLSSPTRVALNPQMAVSRNGDAVAAWLDRHEVIQTATRPAHGHWSAPEVLGDALLFTRPQVMINDRGDAIVGWQRNGDELVTSTHPAGGRWSPPATLNGSAGAFDLRMAMSATGAAIAVWAGDGIQAATLSPDGTWSSPETISDTGTEPQNQHPRAAINDRGDAVAAWQECLDPFCDTWVVQAASRSSGSRWSVPTIVSSTDGIAVAPVVGITRKGDAVVVWFFADHAISFSVLKYATQRRARAWSPPTPLTTDGFAGTPEVTVNPRGDAVAYWFHSPDSTNRHTVVQAAFSHRRGRGGD